jgi:microcystin-dependent protein
MDYYLGQIILISGPFRPTNLDYQGVPYLLACDGSFYNISNYLPLYNLLRERSPVTESSDGLKFAIPNLPSLQNYYYYGGAPRYYIVANPGYPSPAVR